MRWEERDEGKLQDDYKTALLFMGEGHGNDRLSLKYEKVYQDRAETSGDKLQ